MSGLQIIQIPVLLDNDVYLVHEPAAGLTGVVDPSLAEPVLDALKHHGWNLDFIINTHHHWDHTGGNIELKAETGAKVVGPLAEAARIPLIDKAFKEGERFQFGQAEAQILDIPGHTSGHIAFWFADNDVLFCGDTLFSLGCGRLFEGTPEMMFTALHEKLGALPDSTRVYCGHEYTESNLEFAAHVEPENEAVREKLARVRKIRARKAPDWHDASPEEMTIPSNLRQERATNPFLRAADAAELGRIRSLKDAF